MSKRAVKALPLLSGLFFLSLGILGAGPVEPRSGDATPYMKAREFFLHEARPDPLHRKFEELFGKPFPEKGFHQFEPFRPFADVERFNDAFELMGAAGAEVSESSQDGKRTVRVRIPGSESKTLDVHVGGERIFLALRSGGEPGRYRLARWESQALPLPAGVRPESAKVSREADLITIVFDER